MSSRVGDVRLGFEIDGFLFGCRFTRVADGVEVGFEAEVDDFEVAEIRR